MTPVIRVLVGPTAAGKTGVATAVAKQLGGIVVSADARQIYRGLDVATGKEGDASSFDLPGLGRTRGRVADGTPQIGLIHVAEPLLLCLPPGRLASLGQGEPCHG